MRRTSPAPLLAREVSMYPASRLPSRVRSRHRPRSLPAPDTRPSSAARVGAVVVLVTWALVSRADAATFTVNSTADAVEWNPGDGICETAAGNGVCTLRAAIQETNALPGADIINLP